MLVQSMAGYADVLVGGVGTSELDGGCSEPQAEEFGSFCLFRFF